ncbi:MAG: metallophosphoesterase family protein [Balneolaceae bacterium]|nr:metallophosphoesterase family protein [Balneolaceae bacterium]
MDEYSAAQPLLFLSDAHLGGFSHEKNEEIERQLIHLLDYCQQNNIKLFVLGDLFDYWMEYPNHVPELANQLNARFKSYNKTLGPTLYITGNHDNWTRSYFEEIGFRVEPDYRFIKAGEQKLLLLHGDGLLNGQQNLRRPPMHRLLRNKIFISYYQKVLPPAAGLWVMKWFSRLNRLFGGIREDEIPLNRWAEKTLEESDKDIIICGHDHFPRKKKFRFGTYLNLGTFYKHQTVALYNNNHVDLVVWNDRKRQLDIFVHN